MVDLPGFSIQVSDFMDVGPRRTVRRFKATITEDETGKSATNEFGPRLHLIEPVLESLVLMNFGESEAAQKIRERRGVVPVTIRQDLEGNHFSEVHHALRVSCDGPGTSLWWYFLNEAETEVRCIVGNGIESRLQTLVDKKLSFAQVAEHLRLAWDEAFSMSARTAQNILDQDLRKARQGTGYDLLAELSVPKLQKVHKQLVDGTLMTNYLTKDDWKGMAARLVDFK